LDRQENDSENGPDLNDKRRDLGNLRLGSRGNLRINMGPPKITRKKIGGADAHHRSRNQRSDRYRRKIPCQAFIPHQRLGEAQSTAEN
jgi:hypothetical protein